MAPDLGVVVAEMNTGRMRLVPFSAADGPRFKELDSDPAVMTYLTDGVPSTDEQVAASCARVLATQEKHGGRFGVWLAFEKMSGEYMGWFLFRPDKKDPDNTQEIELGYRLKQKFWGQGFASEGGKAFLARGFQQERLKAIFAITMLANLASQAVMKKIGMRHVGDYQEMDFPGADKRAVRYRITREEYEAQQGN